MNAFESVTSRAIWASFEADVVFGDEVLEDGSEGGGWQRLILDVNWRVNMLDWRVHGLEATLKSDLDMISDCRLCCRGLGYEPMRFT